VHVRVWRERPQQMGPERAVALRRCGGLWFGLAAAPATLGPDWLVGLAEQLLADAGLIGVPRSELATLLEHKAAAAAPGGVRCRRSEGAGWSLGGLSGATSFYDLLRAAYEALGREAQACYAALDHWPQEVRVVCDQAPGAGALAMVGAGLGARLRPLLRTSPAATGAALVAAVSLGVYPDFAAADADWVAPHLGGAPAEAQIALAPLSSGRIAPVTRRASSEAR
jgi:erythritol kinase